MGDMVSTPIGKFGIIVPAGVHALAYYPDERYITLENLVWIPGL
jgi:hypothetical protein